MTSCNNIKLGRKRQEKKIKSTRNNKRKSRKKVLWKKEIAVPETKKWVKIMLKGERKP